jgi:hypothetical protein
LLALPGPAGAQVPRVGEVQRLEVITVSLRVGSTEKDSRHITYTPPPGWYVRSHAVTCTARWGHSSYSVTTVPARWEWLSEDKVRESYRSLLDLALRARDVALQGRYARERDAVLRELRRARATHHALVVEATAGGEGLLRGGGGLDLKVTAELVYVGTEAGLARAGPRRASLLPPPDAVPR